MIRRIRVSFLGGRFHEIADDLVQLSTVCIHLQVGRQIRSHRVGGKQVQAVGMNGAYGQMVQCSDQSPASTLKECRIGLGQKVGIETHQLRSRVGRQLGEGCSYPARHLGRGGFGEGDGHQPV